MLVWIYSARIWHAVADPCDQNKPEELTLCRDIVPSVEKDLYSSSVWGQCLGMLCLPRLLTFLFRFSFKLIRFFVSWTNLSAMLPDAFACSAVWFTISNYNRNKTENSIKRNTYNIKNKPKVAPFNSSGLCQVSTNPEIPNCLAAKGFCLNYVILINFGSRGCWKLGLSVLFGCFKPRCLPCKLFKTTTLSIAMFISR